MAWLSRYIRLLILRRVGMHSKFISELLVFEAERHQLLKVVYVVQRHNYGLDPALPGFVKLLFLPQ